MGSKHNLVPEITKNIEFLIFLSGGLYLILQTPSRWYGRGCEAGDDVDILLLVVRDSYLLPTANGLQIAIWPALIIITHAQVFETIKKHGGQGYLAAP